MGFSGHVNNDNLNKTTTMTTTYNAQSSSKVANLFIAKMVAEEIFEVDASVTWVSIETERGIYDISRTGEVESHNPNR